MLVQLEAGRIVVGHGGHVHHAGAQVAALVRDQDLPVPTDPVRVLKPEGLVGPVVGPVPGPVGVVEAPAPAPAL